MKSESVKLHDPVGAESTEVQGMWISHVPLNNMKEELPSPWLNISARYNTRSRVMAQSVSRSPSVYVCLAFG